MSAPGEYQIIDEPSPTRLARFGVDPMWPMFGLMFAGVWLAWPWFVFNALAVGSPTRAREATLAVFGVAFTAGLALLFGALFSRGLLPSGAGWIALLAITLVKLGVTYWLYAWQQRGFELYRYFGGPVRNGMLGVFAGAVLRPYVAATLSPFLGLVLL